MPFTLFPVDLDRSHYLQMVDAQRIVNELTYKLAKDTIFLESTLENVVKTDNFTRNLLDLNRRIQKEGQAQPLISCLLRTDYMIRQPAEDGVGEKNSLQQVETNVIAAGMPALSPIIRSLHEHILIKYKIQLPSGSELVECKALDLIASAMIEAYDAYGQADSYILLVREERSNNFSDHVLIETEVVRLRPDIRFLRVPFGELHEISKLGPNKELLLNQNQEVALIYFRNCYDPSNFDFPESWPTRILLEQSRAIKCPSIQFHLAGAKKFQQVLSPPGPASQRKRTLERFLSAKDSALIGELMCEFWPLDPGTTEGEQGFQIGIKDRTGRWVLKPQREGGGHNMFGKDIPLHLEKLLDQRRQDERSQFILMELIDSLPQQNKLLTRDNELVDVGQDDQFTLEPMINEVGIFGSILADVSGVIYSNEADGYFTRSKKQGVNEGGISSGNAGITSLLLR